MGIVSRLPADVFLKHKRAIIYFRLLFA